MVFICYCTFNKNSLEVGTVHVKLNGTLIMGLGKIVSDVELHNLVYNPNPNLNG